MAQGTRQRLKRRRQFAAWIAASAVILLIVAVLLSDSSGVVHVISLVCLAYGLGFGVSAVFLAFGWNPLSRRGGADGSS